MDDPVIEFMGRTLRLTHFVGVDVEDSGMKIAVQPGDPDDYRIVRVEASIDSDPPRYRRRGYRPED